MISTFQGQSNYCKQSINAVNLQLQVWYFRNGFKSIVNCATRRATNMCLLAETYAGSHVVIYRLIGSQNHRQTDRMTEQLTGCSRYGPHSINPKSQYKGYLWQVCRLANHVNKGGWAKGTLLASRGSTINNILFVLLLEIILD